MSLSDLQPIIDWLNAHQGWVAFAIALISFIESLAIAGVIVPGVMLLFMVAVVAGGGALSLDAALFWAFMGAIAGDGVSFFIGHYFSDSIASKWPVKRYPQLLESGKVFFRKHGGKSILIGRFIGPLRPILPLIAGMLKMPPKRFLLFNIISAVGWAPVYILPGYLVGASISLDIALPPHFYPILFGALGLLALLYLVFVRLQWGLQQQSDLYESTHRWMHQFDITQRLWQALSNKRNDSGEFPLPSLFLAALSLALFSLLSIIVSNTVWLDIANQRVLDFFAFLRNPFYDPLMIVITLLGDSTYLYLSFPIFVMLLLFRGYYAASLHIAVAGIATSLLTHGLKDYIATSRPDVVLNGPSSFAFPSGHTSGTVVFMGLFAAFIAQELPQKKRWVTYALFSIPMLMVGLSRLYLGVHWMTDVVGGLLLGLCICAITRISYSRFDKQTLSVDIFTWIAIIAWISLSIIYIAIGLPDAILNYQPKT